MGRKHYGVIPWYIVLAGAIFIPSLEDILEAKIYECLNWPMTCSQSVNIRRYSGKDGD